MLQRVKDRLRRAADIDISELLTKILRNPQIEDDIIYYNTIDQLFEKGQDKLGRRLDDIGGGYAPFTIQYKLEKGQPIDRVTLKDTGEFYDSFRVSIQDGYIEIIANPLKNGKDINREWGGHVIGLQPENMGKIIDFVREKMVWYIKKDYLAA